MKGTLLFLFALTAAALPLSAAAEIEWMTDVRAAMDKAHAENKVVMLDFTGSDWCPWCIKLKGEVFDQPEFAAFAKESIVAVEVDFPRQKQLSGAQKSANAQLAQAYHITGYPTIVVINWLGQELGRDGYREGGAKNYIARLEALPGVKHAGASVAERPEPYHPKPDYTPIPPAASIAYGDLALKAISGTKERRMALINNETFMVGDTAKVKVKDKRVEVTCREIRDDAVVVVVEGKTMTLRMANY